MQDALLLTELNLYHSLRRCAVIALVEKQIESTLNRWEAAGKVFGTRNVEQFVGTGEHLFGARNALLDRRMAADECARNLIYAEAAQDVKD